MHHILAGSRTRLTYLQDRRALAAIDWPVVLDDLIEAGSNPTTRRWRDLEGLTHVVLAADQVTGHYTGLLGLIERTTPPERWLLIETAMVRSGEKGVTLRRAMLAHVLARVVCLDGKPTAMAASNGDRSIEPALRDLGMNIRLSELHPPVDGNLIMFETASLAHRIGTGFTILDLRAVSESSLLRDLRDLHDGRTGGVRQRERPLPPVILKPARSGGATRRPKKATRTGRNG